MNRRAIAMVFAFTAAVLVCMCTLIVRELDAPGFTEKTLSRQEKVRAPLGETETVYTMLSGDFQDFVDHIAYRIAEPELEGNAYFVPVQAEDAPEIEQYIADSGMWARMTDEQMGEKSPFTEYEFGRDWVTEADWFYVYNRYPDSPLDCYDLWLLDVDVDMLYYFHNNI